MIIKFFLYQTCFVSIKETTHDAQNIYIYINGAPGVLGIWGEWLFIFWELGSTGNFYFKGSREQAHSFGDLGSPAKK